MCLFSFLNYFRTTIVKYIGLVHETGEIVVSKLIGHLRYGTVEPLKEVH